MRNNSPRWSVEQLIREALTPVALLCSNTVADIVKKVLPFPRYSSIDLIPNDTATLFVVGGGTLLDIAKIDRYKHWPDRTLIAVPSLWGSGAEISPIAVAQILDNKVFTVDEKLLPDAHVILPALLEQLPPQLAHYGCGDAWSHALEGSLSPLANATQQANGSALIKDMMAAGLTKTTAWFDLSQRACSLQSQTSVGLIHGIAHTLEAPLKEAFPEGHWGHAKLCSVFLWPVLKLCSVRSEKWQNWTETQAIDRDAVEQITQAFFEHSAYQQSLPQLEKNWKKVLRNPLTRTNHTLIRRNDVDFFLTGAFQ